MYVLISPPPVNRPLTWNVKPSRLECWRGAYASDAFKNVPRTGFWAFAQKMTKLGYNVVSVESLGADK